jgi:hypothetical protein
MKPRSRFLLVIPLQEVAWADGLSNREASWVIDNTEPVALDCDGNKTQRRGFRTFSTTTRQ